MTKSKFIELLFKRRSIRSFKPMVLRSEQIELLKQSIKLSPSSKNKKPYRFIFVDNPTILSTLSLVKKEGAHFIAEASLAVVVIGIPQISDVWIEDASIASIILQLTAEDIGLSSCWVQIRNRQHQGNTSAGEFVKQALKLPVTYEILAIIAIGKKNENKELNTIDDTGEELFIQI